MSENNVNGTAPASPAENPDVPPLFGLDKRTVDECIDDFTGKMLAAGASEGRARELAMAFAGGMAYFAGMIFRLRQEAHAMAPNGPTIEAINHLFQGQTPMLDDAVGIYMAWLNEGKRPFRFQRAHH